MVRKPNYDFDKRRKEQDRKAKKDAKRADRQQRRDERQSEDAPAPASPPSGEERPDIGPPDV
jgi:hypothetical protein